MHGHNVLAEFDSGQVAGHLGYHKTGYPMEREALDILRPLSTTERRDRYILVTGDYYTKWMEASRCLTRKANSRLIVY